MPEVLASTCGTLLSSQGSDAHRNRTLSGRFWGNPSNLLPWTHLVNLPHWHVSKLEGLSIVPLIGRASDRSFGAIGMLSLVRSVAFFSPPRALPSLAARKRLRAGYGQVKSRESRACRPLAPGRWHVRLLLPPTSSQKSAPIRRTFFRAGPRSSLRQGRRQRRAHALRRRRAGC